VANERLRGALAARGLTAAACAESIGVDAKTVERWIIRERVPHRTHRVKAADLLGVEETYLWPSLAHDQRTVSAGRAELIEFYPSRASVPAELWRSLIDDSRESIDVLVFAGLFLPEVHDIARLAARAQSGCRIRLLLGDPSGNAVQGRGREEGLGNGLAHRILLSLRYYQSILPAAGIELRLHNTTLYASIFRSDDSMLVNAHIYGSTAGQNPVLHLRRVPGGRVFDQYVNSFDKVWATAVECTDIDSVINRFDRSERGTP
jgi:transcriptional regulator with XRE-family HTH domain